MMTLTDRYESLIIYMYAKIEEKDWHAVSDVANDIRVFEAEHPEFKTYEIDIKKDSF